MCGGAQCYCSAALPVGQQVWDLPGGRELLLLDWRTCSKLGHKPMDSKVLCSPGQPGWGPGMFFFVLVRMLGFCTAGYKPAHSYLWLGNLPMGRQQPSAVPLKHLLTSVFECWLDGPSIDPVWQLLCSFPAWLLRLALALAVDHRSECGAKPRCSLQKPGVSPVLGAAWACLQLGSHAGTVADAGKQGSAQGQIPACLVIFRGTRCSVCTRFSAVAKF